MNAVVLIIAPGDDDHVAAVAPRLAEAGAEPLVFDLSSFPRDAALSFALDAGSGAPLLALAFGGRSFDLGEARSVWWRRPKEFTLHAEVGRAVSRFALQECHAALGGLFRTLRARWMNDFAAEQVALYKPHQLATAKAVGLAVPRTLVTNAPARARAFVEACGWRDDRANAIFKTLTAVPGGPATRRPGKAELDALDTVRFAPVIFQEYVEGVDLRVVAVERELFAMEVDARKTAYPEDVRKDWKTGRALARAADLPDEVGRRLHAVMDRLGLVYGAFDLRRRDDGEHVFLEVNPSGQWLYVEAATGHPITDAVVRLLSRPS